MSLYYEPTTCVVCGRAVQLAIGRGSAGLLDDDNGLKVPHICNNALIAAWRCRVALMRTCASNALESAGDPDATQATREAVRRESIPITDLAGEYSNHLDAIAGLEDELGRARPQLRSLALILARRIVESGAPQRTIFHGGYCFAAHYDGQGVRRRRLVVPKTKGWNT